jgi:hypothetical protein
MKRIEKSNPEECSGSVILWYGFGCGSLNPYHGFRDPDSDLDLALSSVTFKMPTKNIVLK